MLGQVTAICYFYLRSSLTNFASLFISFHSFTLWIDFIFLACVGVIFFRNRIQEFISVLFQEIQRSKSVVVIIVLLGAVLVNHELPRTLMLSTDPDQHLYFATQIHRFGEVPFQQRWYGPSSFGYPAGFAVLSVLWHMFTTLPLPWLITIVPIIQILLGIGIVLEFVGKHIRFNPITVIFLCCSFYLNFLPWGYQREVWHLEGAARLASFGMTAYLLAVLGEERKNSEFKLLLIIASLGFCNPSLLPLSFSFVFLQSFINIGSSLIAKLRNLSVATITTLLFLFLDPYYFRFIFPSLLTAPAHSEIISEVKDLSNNSASLFLELLTMFFRIIDVPIVGIALGVLIAALILWKQLGKRITVIYLFIPFGVVLIYAAIRTLLPVVQHLPGGSLIDPYIRQHVITVAVLYSFVTFVIIASRISRYTILSLLLIVSTLYFHKDIRLFFDHANRFNLNPRNQYCPDNQCDLKDDLIVLKQMERKFENYRLLGRPLDYESVPKILVLNAPVIIGNERWLLPTGASRILPTFNTFPLAFYYFQGSPDYSYELYQKNICQSLNLQWLREKNIRYLFVPSYNFGCLRKKAALLLQGKIIEQSGKSMFIDISNVSF
jgi:hypothetical protein